MGVHAAVDEQNLSGDEAASVRCEQESRSDELVGFGDAFEEGQIRMTSCASSGLARTMSVSTVPGVTAGLALASLGTGVAGYWF